MLHVPISDNCDHCLRVSFSHRDIYAIFAVPLIKQSKWGEQICRLPQLKKTLLETLILDNENDHKRGVYNVKNPPKSYKRENSQNYVYLDVVYVKRDL